MDYHAELLMKIEENTRKQLRAARIQCVFSLIAAVCCIAVLIAVMQLIPVVEDLAVHAETILTDLEITAHHLAQIDLAQTLENLNALMTTSQSGVAEAIDKLNAIDIETLNGAIEDLAEIIKPLADAIKWFG